MSTPNKIPNPNPNPNETWTIVSHRRNRKQTKRNPYLHPNSPQIQIQTLTLKPSSPWTPLDSESDPIRQSKLLYRIESSISKLQTSQFYSRFLSRFRDTQIQNGLARLLSFKSEIQFVIYGIGSIESYETPRLQLSLALLLYQELKPTVKSVEVFDPILSSVECVVIEKLGFTVIKVDEQGRREVKNPTLFFMPHCEVQLYDNLLDANWKPETLNRMVLLGNSFGEYGRYVCEMRGGGGSVNVEVVGKKVIWVRSYVREVGMEGSRVEGGREEEEGDGFFRAFHDMSWHFFELDDDTDMNII